MTQHTDVTVIYNTQAAVIPLTDRADESTKRWPFYTSEVRGLSVCLVRILLDDEGGSYHFQY